MNKLIILYAIAAIVSTIGAMFTMEVGFMAVAVSCIAVMNTISIEVKLDAHDERTMGELPETNAPAREEDGATTTQD
jgi:hypothetical protein